MLIGVDMDNVLMDISRPFCRFLKRAYNIDLRHEDIYTFDIWEILGVTRGRVNEMFSEYYQSHEFRGMQPIEGSQEGVSELWNEGHDLFDITSRPSELIMPTLKTLERDFQNRFVGIQFTRYHLNPNDAPTKGDVCRKLGVDIMIEDSLGFAVECAENGTPVLLLDQPWNQCDDLPQGVTRVNPWHEIVERISSEDF